MSFRLSPTELMQKALDEAVKGGRAVRPNPLVGCAIETRNGEVWAAHHARFGEAHAERSLIQLCREKNISLEGARMAVTLEPCSHHGKTPPCVDVLLDSKIAELYIAMQDPFPKVDGRGIEQLRRVGIKVDVGCLEEKAEELNRAWLFAHRNSRAHLTLKMATSLDGAWASEKGHSKWITNSTARNKAHELRKRVDALISSYKTVLTDDASFTARELDGSLCETQPQVFLLSTSPRPESLAPLKIAQHPKGVQWCQNVEVRSLLESLAQQSLYDVMLEAGPRLSQVFLDSGCVDEIWLFMDTQFLGGARVGFAEAFNKGLLPGFETTLRSVEQLDERSLLLKLLPKRF